MKKEQEEEIEGRIQEFHERRGDAQPDLGNEDG